MKYSLSEVTPYSESYSNFSLRKSFAASLIARMYGIGEASLILAPSPECNDVGCSQTYDFVTVSSKGKQTRTIFSNSC